MIFRGRLYHSLRSLTSVTKVQLVLLLESSKIPSHPHITLCNAPTTYNAISSTMDQAAPSDKHNTIYTYLTRLITNLCPNDPHIQILIGFNEHTKFTAAFVTTAEHTNTNNVGNFSIGPETRPNREEALVAMVRIVEERIQQHIGAVETAVDEEPRVGREFDEMRCM